MDNYVTNRQLYFIILLTLESYSIIKLPKIMAETAGTGFWLTILIAAIIFSFAILIIIKLHKMFYGNTLYEYSTIIVGKVATWVIGAFYLIYFILITALLQRSISEIVKNAFLPKTPQWMPMFVLFAIVTYSATRGIANIGRIFEFFGIITVIVIVFLQLLVSIEGEFIYLKPFFDSSMIADYAKAIPKVMLPFLGFEVLTVIPFVEQENKRATRYCVLSIFTVALIYIASVATTFMMLSVEDTIYYTEPLIRAIRRVDLPSLQIFQRLDVFFVTSWFFSIFCSLTITVYTASFYANKLIPKLKMQWIVPVICLICFIIALLPRSSVDVSRQLRFLISNFGLIPPIIIPAILLIIAKVKKNAGKLP